MPLDIPPDAPTPVWNALDAALDAFKGIEGRRVVLVLSDGKNEPDFGFNRRFLTEVEIIDRAQREEVMFYGVGFWSRAARCAMPGGFGARGGMGAASGLLSDMPDSGLGTLALETGGRLLRNQAAGRPGRRLRPCHRRAALRVHPRVRAA
jgi:hypothetical protein